MSPATACIVLLATLALVGGAGPAPAAAEPSLVGQWRFDEPDGQRAIDDGPHGLDGRLGSTDAPDSADPGRITGIAGGALQFDGPSYVRLPDADEFAVQSLTIEAVVRAPSSPGDYRYIMSRGSWGCFAGSYGLYTGSTGGVALYVFDGSRYVVSASAARAHVWDGAWHHVAVTFDGGALRLYLDGRQVGDPAPVQRGIDYFSTSTSAAFGRYAGSSCQLPFRGDLDLVRIWSGALSSGSVAAAAARAVQPGSGAPSGVLPAAAPPTILRAPPGSAPAGSAPGAPPRACALRLSRTRIQARRRTPVRVRVTIRGRPARSVRVIARRHGRAEPITAARTGANGGARLVLRVRRPGRVWVGALVRPSCVRGHIRVTRSM